MNRILRLVLAPLVVLWVGLSYASPADGEEPGSPENPIVVSSPDEVPEGAVVVSEVVNDDCSTTTVWVVTDEGSEPVTHQEWGTEERTRTATEVPDYTTEYHFRKFTHTKTKPRHGGWSEYGPWTPWVPETHTSWQTSTDPLGVPQFHGEGTYQDGTKWYREWQAQFDGQTRQVQTGSHVEYGEWTEWTTLETGLLEEPVLPPNTDTHEYRATGPVTVVDEEAVDPSAVYYTHTDDEVCEEPPSEEPPSEEPPSEEPPVLDEEFCISPDTVKIVHFEKQDGDWVDVGADFRPATASDGCAEQDLPPLKETGF